MSVKFEDYSMNVIAEINETSLKFLKEAGIELTAKTKSNSRPVKYGSHDVKGSWNYNVDNSEGAVSIGSPLEAAYWEEFGTGEHAIDKSKSRKGWWVYVEGSDNGGKSTQKVRTEQEAKDTAAYLRSQGLDAHYTNGVDPNTPLQRAFTDMKPKIIAKADALFKEMSK